MGQCPSRRRISKIDIIPVVLEDAGDPDDAVEMDLSPAISDKDYETMENTCITWKIPGLSRSYYFISHL
ncbi:hypothetical protein PO124_03750 [Bacillus licheniformis]|nr:hypothetical protein [Bacillus licheniformis]